MRRLRMAGVALGSAVAGAALVFALAGLFSASTASAVGPSVSVGSATMAVGNQGNVSLNALSIAAPGLGAWSLNVSYDPAIVSVIACAASAGGVCNPNFSADTVRTAGAAATGLQGDSALATVTFRCIHVGMSGLTITIDTLADATAGAPQDISASIVNGSVTCLAPPTPSQPTAVAPTSVPPTPTATAIPVVAKAPNAGFGPGGSDGGTTTIIWLVAGLIGAGFAWLSAGMAGAGLAALTQSAGRRASASPRTPQGFLPRMTPTKHRATRGAEPTDGPSSSSSNSSLDMPSFRPNRRPEDKR